MEVFFLTQKLTLNILFGLILAVAPLGAFAVSDTITTSEVNQSGWYALSCEIPIYETPRGTSLNEFLNLRDKDTSTISRENKSYWYSFTLYNTGVDTQTVYISHGFYN